MVAVAENKLSPAGAAFNGRHADLSTTSSGTQPLVNNLYQGMTLDAVTGLYYERYRDYSSTLGRWMERDPIGYAGGINLYEYVGGGNPTAWRDPNGTPVEEPPGVGPLESLNTFKELLEAAIGISVIYVCHRAHARCQEDMWHCGDMGVASFFGQGLIVM